MNKGQKVVCINDKYLKPIVNPIKKDETYTIRDFIKGYRPDGGYAPAVYLEEIRNIIFLGHEIGYDAARFRPLDSVPGKVAEEPKSLVSVH